ncbi:MAG: hypothetical protein HY201_01395 [Nitrospirae bacterium]|nr:hypothetical protein [Candidatus Troglogloeales bacterium]MBI3598103.1 hypothetical protein [Candidatus Troglogloeales bacterium]
MNTVGLQLMKRMTYGISLFLLLTFIGCGGSFSSLKKGAKTIVTGEIDAIERMEVFLDEKKKLSVTVVSFASGQGIALIGLQPGLSKGKRVKIDAEFFENLQGTDLFRAISTTTESPVSVPKVEKTVPIEKSMPEKSESAPASPADAPAPPDVLTPER